MTWAAINPWRRSFPPARPTNCTSASLIGWKAVRVYPNERDTVRPFRGGAISSRDRHGRPFSSWTRRSPTTVILRRIAFGSARFRSSAVAIPCASSHFAQRGPPGSGGTPARTSHRNCYSPPTRKSAGPLGHLAAKRADTAGHHAPDQQLLVGCDGDDGVAVIGRAELDQVALPEQPLHG
jgi:hypothetical protein